MRGADYSGEGVHWLFRHHARMEVSHEVAQSKQEESHGPGGRVEETGGHRCRLLLTAPKPHEFQSLVIGLSACAFF